MKELSLLMVLLFSTSVYSQGNPCAGLWSGEIVAHPDRCDQFYMCILTIPTPVNCNSGLIFDKSRLVCVPGDPATCEIYVETTPGITTTTSATTTTYNPILNIICSGLFFAARPYPGNSAWYIGCIRGVGEIRYCLPNEEFNSDINECAISETTSTAAQSTTTLSVLTTVPTVIEGLCRGRPAGNIPHPQFCALFIYCFDEEEFIRQCPEFHIFDNTTASCQPGNQNTCELGVVSTTAPSTTSGPTSISTTPSTVVTESTTAGTIPITIETTPTLPVTASSPLVTDSTAALTSTISTPTTTFVFNPCEGIDFGFVPDDENCANFYECIMGRYVPRECPVGQIFSRGRLTCASGNRDTCQLD